ncbi:MAG: VWA domain-containing protein [Dehalococcoidia bacterium]|nr:VWA domain-containing protein [Dehalococcoidia bacterium]
MQLGEPGYLALSLIVVAMGAAAIWLGRWRQMAQRRFAGPQASRWQASAFWPRMGLLLLAAALIVLAAARPQWGSSEVTREREAVDLVILLDISQSMQATDAEPTRLGQAQTELRRLIEALRNNRIGLVLFAGSSILRSPLTTDSQAMIQLIERADAETGLTRVGSDIGGALDQAGRILDASESAGKAVLVVSDGEDHVGGFRAKAAELREKGILIYAAGAGTPAGSTLNEVDPRTRQPRLKVDAQGNPVITRLMETTLQSVADAGGGRYVRLGDDGLFGLRDDIAQLQQTPIGAETQSVPIERFQGFVGVALALLVASWLLPGRLSLRLPSLAQRPKPGLAMLLLAVVAGACGGDTLRSQNGDANRLFETGDFEGALSAYQALVSQRPDVPELSYNAGNTLHRLESYERAIEETQRALPSDSTKLGAATYFALGNHLLALDQLEQAFDAYRSALLLDPDDGDAKHNLEITLARLLAQQQQQEQEQEQQPGEGAPGEGEEGEEPEPSEGTEGAPQQPSGEPAQPGAPGTQPPADPVRSLQEALEGIDEDLTFEEAIQILDALREQQQRQRQDQAPGGTSGPDY